MAGNSSLPSELDTVLVKVASRCNINCTYCYVYNMGDDNWSHMEKLMSRETMDAVCTALGGLVLEQERTFSVVLHGGEPFLLGAGGLSYLLSGLRAVLSPCYPISIQTNGLLITREILDICSAYMVSVAVSIDGPEHVHNKYRLSHQRTGTFKKVLEGIEQLKSHPDAAFLNAGLLAVVDPVSNPVEVYQFFKAIGTPSVDFLYKDGNHTRLPLHKASITSIEYGQWMSALLWEYITDPAPMPIRILDDMLKAMMGGMVSKEGIGVTDFGIVIIDTDGTIMKNDTLKSSFNGADKFETAVNIKEGKLNVFLHSEQFREYRTMQKPTSRKCLDCAALNICGGGMVLHRWKKDNGFDNPSVYCADQLHLISNMRKAIAQFQPDYG